ncbi:MAG TPA: hypothetical protein P5555_21135, partial [Candidatus Paceibacterota bacterium]|nr:hypothetical protein [Verrucomicrobiota bacterium]HRZ47686.1 hypothetical protein [Candidatus Paceibacterota bacterium]
TCIFKPPFSPHVYAAANNHEEAKILFASYCVLWGNESSVVKGILDCITTEDTESTESIWLHATNLCPRKDGGRCVGRPKGRDASPTRPLAGQLLHPVDGVVAAFKLRLYLTTKARRSCPRITRIGMPTAER